MKDNLIDTFTEEELSLYSSWSKEAIYEAYISEQKTRIRINEELNEERRKLKEIKWKLLELMKQM